MCRLRPDDRIGRRPIPLQMYSTYPTRSGGCIAPCRQMRRLEAIMFGKSGTFAVALAILAASGCASFPGRDPALDDARLSLDAARRNPQVAMYASAEFDQAAATLRQADDLVANGGRYDDVHQLAVLANQRAATAQNVARLRSEQAALVAQRTATDARIQADVTQRQAAAALLGRASGCGHRLTGYQCPGRSGGRRRRRHPWPSDRKWPRARSCDGHRRGRRRGGGSERGS